MSALDHLHDPDSRHESPLLDRRFTRRRFLTLTGAVVATGLLSACMGDDESDDNDTVTPSEETPAVGGSPETGSPTSAATDANLERFMALSRALTGFDNLDDTVLGQVYFGSIEGSDELGGQLSDLYDKAGLADGIESVTIDQLESAGAFDEDTGPVANAITTAWYTGTYDSGGGDVAVATYINALAWQATGYRMTGPSSCSGATGNWTAPPAA